MSSSLASRCAFASTSAATKAIRSIVQNKSQLALAATTANSACNDSLQTCAQRSFNQFSSLALPHQTPAQRRLIHSSASVQSSASVREPTAVVTSAEDESLDESTDNAIAMQPQQQQSQTTLSASPLQRRKDALLKDSSVDPQSGFSIAGSFLSGRSVYLDMQATTPLDYRVLDAMMPYYTFAHGNPHSRTHHYGWETEQAIERAREQVAKLIGAEAKEIIFTSGATESNNASLKGIMRFYGQKKKHLITTQTEHKCVLDSARQLGLEGYEVTYLPVQKDGLVDLAALEAAIRPGETALISVMYVNNEIGVIQPIDEIGALCRKHKVFLHTDAAQALGKIPIDVNKSNIDLMSMSGHKIYGPKGVGALYVRRRPRVRLAPLLSGGGQERGFRSGTLPTPLCVGMGEACRIALQEMDSDTAHAQRLADKLISGIRKEVEMVILNGHAERRYPGNVNLSFSYVEGESLLMALKEIAVSSGSACTSASLEPSYVLRALGVEEDMAHTSIRFGIGRFTTEEEIDHAVRLCVRHVQRLRDMSPLWEMVQQGIDLKTIKWTN